MVGIARCSTLLSSSLSSLSLSSSSLSLSLSYSHYHHITLLSSSLSLSLLSSSLSSLLSLSSLSSLSSDFLGLGLVLGLVWWCRYKSYWTECCIIAHDIDECFHDIDECCIIDIGRENVSWPRVQAVPDNEDPGFLMWYTSSQIILVISNLY